VGSPYDDFLGDFKGDNTIQRVSGGDGNDYLFDANFMAGGNGNDRLALDRENHVYGGSGQDIFLLYFFSTGEKPDGAVINDFAHGEDRIHFVGARNASLSHEGDTWTVHGYNELGLPTEATFEISGVTQLQLDQDYIWV
jgi:hypothetical protein